MKKKFKKMTYRARRFMIVPVIKFLIRILKWVHKRGRNVEKAIAHNKTLRSPLNVLSHKLKPKKYKHRGRIVWKSRIWGTYIRAIHGELK